MSIRRSLSFVVILLLIAGVGKAEDLLLEVGSNQSLLTLTGGDLTTVDFPQVPTDSNLVFKVDSSGWNLQDTDRAAIGFSIQRGDRNNTESDEYRRAMMVIYPVRVQNGKPSLTELTVLQGWGWKYDIESPIVAHKTVSGLNEVSKYVDFSESYVKVDYHGLRQAAGLSVTSDPNQFSWEYRFSWSNHFSVAGMVSLSSEELTSLWLPRMSFGTIKESVVGETAFDSFSGLKGFPGVKLINSMFGDDFYSIDFSEVFGSVSGFKGQFTVGVVPEGPMSVQTDLYPGWNLIMPHYDVAIGENGLSQGRVTALWEIDLTCIDDACPSLTALDVSNTNQLAAKTPYWLLLNGDSPVSLIGEVLANSTESKSGSRWGLYSVAKEQQADTVLIEQSIKSLWHWDSEEKKWLSSVLGVPSFLNTLKVLKPGRAYYFPAQ